MTQPLRWGVLGAGMIARGVTPCIARAEGCEVAGIAAREPHRARTLLDEIETGGMAYTYEEMLHDDRVDAVYVTLPNHLHTEWTCRFLQAGKHVLCEKPLCATRAEAERIRDCAQEHGRLVGEGFMYMHHPQTAALVRLAGKPDSPLGALKRVHAAFCVHQTHEPTILTRMSHACQGGSIMDLGCYSLSFMTMLWSGVRGGTVDLERVETNIAPPLTGEEFGVDDDIVVRGRIIAHGGCLLPKRLFEIPFTAEASFSDPRGVFVELVGEKATARTGWPWAPQHDRAEITLTRADGSAMEPIVIEDGREKFELQFEAFAQAVRTGGVFEPSLDWSVEQAAMIERVRAMGGLPKLPST